MTADSNSSSPSAPATPETLAEALERLACMPVLLVASDYDGTLAPIVDDPARATPQRESLVALEALARLPHTSVAILSGRGLADLARLTSDPVGVRLVGSHGSEFDVGFADALSDDKRALRGRILRDLQEIAARAAGLDVETKPAGAAFHYRRADPEAARSALAAVLAGPAAEPGVHLRHGKCVLELSVVPTSKGEALSLLRSREGASAVLFMGDDITDEDGFAVLRGPDVGVKIGSGESAASQRLQDPIAVAQTLARLAELRAGHFCGAVPLPIESLTLLSDQRTVALVSPNANIVWHCAPRIDSAAIFAELLGGAQAGHFSVSSADGAPPLHQRYGERDLVLETTFPNFTVCDYLDASGGRPRQRPGRTDLVRVLTGTGRVRVRFAPRLDFGRQATRLEVRPGGLAVVDSIDPLFLRAPDVPFEIRREGSHDTATAEIELGGEPLVLELRYGAGDLRAAPNSERSRRDGTRRFWSDWSEALVLPQTGRDLVLRSALTLRALCHGPSGAIAAAATTSLPESMSGVRNWDYRYAWPRDAAMSARALVHLGVLDEGIALLDWLLRILEHTSSPERLRPIYSVSGAELGTEAEIAELSGYGGSRPVRVGNGAAHQVQLDVFGPIVELILALARAGAPLSAEHWRLCEAMVEAVARRWHEPDHGIWEIRAPARHHVHSKVMCWTALDRGRTLAEEFFDRKRPAWGELADRIRAQVLERGWKEARGAFTAAYAGDDLDAAVLQVGLSGMLEGSDPRFHATVAAIEEELRDGPTVYRYRTDDGLPGREGGFHLLAAWLGEAYLAIGRPQEARAVFDGLAGLAGPTGLLSEQYDPIERRALGNHPQAYSHLGLIELALGLDRAAARG